MVGINDLILPQIFISNSAEQTREFGMKFGAQLLPNSVLCFFGDLGAGKTTFIQGLTAGVLGSQAEEVNSPTFTYLNIYHGNKTLYHFDLYRLRDADEFLSMGFDETFDAGGITCVEWAEKIAAIIPEGTIYVKMTHLGGDQRKIEIHV
ncbi:MAG TPA: tRNA (adenosine(37)-N6)-threonylcarbamoyltransferase complex ATPase subunit type 1 TsaE [Parachlamydiaceae bacterium]|nr:tRNA (adenosine(37)-N6)-threonylcarbamoyltransferase complex ATPase subunit type 1 TsaE [Parachlamydiaceae bacterium]